jgi:predicted anti-sigma-YlaC factor YlaD
MTMNVRALSGSVTCTRVREQVSLRLDGELSELEQRMLDSHLTRCQQCRAYSTNVVEFTSALREAPAVPLLRPVIVSRARRISIARLQFGVAAALALAALGLGTQLSSSRSGTEFSGAITRYPTQSELDRELAILGNLPNRDRPVSAGALVL